MLLTILFIPGKVEFEGGILREDAMYAYTLGVKKLILAAKKIQSEVQGFIIKVGNDPAAVASPSGTATTLSESPLTWPGMR